MISKKSRIGNINGEFLRRILPVFNQWGLEQHSSDLANFGKSQHGYYYNFADMRDPLDIKLARFIIISRNSSLIIDALKGLFAAKDTAQVPPMRGDEPRRFTLARRFSFRRLRTLYDISFKLEQRKDETVEAAAARLIDDVVKELPRLKQYLYG